MNPPSIFFIPRILEREKNKKEKIEEFLIVAMSNGTRWLSRFKKEKGEEVDSNFINYKLSLYNLNKTTLGLPILYINLYTGVALHLHPLKKNHS